MVLGGALGHICKLQKLPAKQGENNEMRMNPTLPGLAGTRRILHVHANGSKFEYFQRGPPYIVMHSGYFPILFLFMVLPHF